MGAIALLAAGFVLYRGISRFGEAREALDAAEAKLEGFYQEAVFPSAANVRRENTNTVKLVSWFDELAAELCKGNVVSDERSPSTFKSVYLEKTLARLLQEAQAAGTELPENFGFGFGQYAGTPTLPSPEDVPRLMEQLVLVNRISRILFANRVKALGSVERAAVEATSSLPTTPSAVAPPAPVPAGPSSKRKRPQAAVAPPPPVSKQPGMVPEGALFGKYRFVIEFSAKESALIGVLNALAASPTFTVVKVVRLNKGIPVLMPVTVDSAAAGDVPIPGFGEPSPTAAPVLRIGPAYPVCGLEMEIPMQVRMELDVYKFKGDADGSGD